ncbi:MAG: hypothetical protein KDK23_13050 [Leptospiraceae bacterium]|nr:hypothetical protein [Leptospiraceae bacterium]
MRRGYLAALTFLFLWSTALSAPTFTRPLDLRHDWLTAHTSISLQYMYECGPFRNLGASVLFLPSAELGCDAPTRIQNPGKRIYLSYPSGWLLTYLPFYSVARFLLPENIPSYEIVRGLALLLIRLPLLAALLIMIQRQLMAYPGLSPPRALSLSFLANLAFASSPAFLHYTQNIVFTDMIVLPVIYGSAVLLLHWMDRVEQSEPAEEEWLGSGKWRTAAATGFLLWLAAATDWYGALWSASLLIMLWFRRGEAKLEKGQCLLVAVGPAMAALHYGLQLSLLPAGWEQILITATERTGQKAASLFERWQLWKVTFSYWTFDLPLPVRWANSFLPFALVLFCAFTCLTFLRHCGRLSLRYWILMGPFLMGMLHLIILPEHSAEHDFSALKFGPMIVFAVFFLISLTGPILEQKLKMRKVRTLMQRLLVGILVLLLPKFAMESREKHQMTAGLIQPKQDHLSLRLLSRRLQGALPITLARRQTDGYTPLQATGWDPPQSLALAGREIYTSETLANFFPAFDHWTVQDMPVIVLSFRPEPGLPCRWKETGIAFEGGEALMCVLGRNGLHLLGFAPTMKPGK